MSESSMNNVDVDGRKRQYLPFVPKTYVPEQPIPLVIVFSGGLQSPSDIALMSSWHVLGEEKGFITVYPQTLDAWWNSGVVTIPEKLAVNDVAFTQALIDDISRNWTVDRNRIYLSGVSDGSSMCARLICELSDQFAAASLLAGGHFPLRSGCRPDRPVPIIGFFGTEDIIVPFAGGDSAFFADIGYAQLPSVEAGMKAWAEVYGCDLNPTKEVVLGGVSRLSYLNCKGEVEVVWYRIEGGGHAWPGSSVDGVGRTNREIDATALSWDFFSNHVYTAHKKSG
jgi:polyhydroxybutyrate depolymerase